MPTGLHNCNSMDMYIDVFGAGKMRVIYVYMNRTLSASTSVQHLIHSQDPGYQYIGLYTLYLFIYTR